MTTAYDFTLECFQGLTEDYEVTLKVNGADDPVASGDVVRVKIGKEFGTPDLDLTSDAASENGSSVTATTGSAVVAVRLAQGDTAGLTSGPNIMQVILVDDSETLPANAAKPRGLGLLNVRRSMGGSVSL